MRLAQFVVAAATTLCLLMSYGGKSIAQSNHQSSVKIRLGNIMIETQLRHSKLWFAGRVRNWDLARYEARQIRNSFEDAATLHPEFNDVPIADLIQSQSYEYIDEVLHAIDRQDLIVFEDSFRKLTAACNECHRATRVEFIRVHVPHHSPFSNQLFEPLN